MKNGPKRKRVTNSKTLPQASDQAQNFYNSIITQIGRDAFFLDTGAILESFVEHDNEYVRFLRGVQGRLITSSFVVAETVRRVTKTRHGSFVGPAGERNRQLASYFLRVWLTEKRVSVLAVPAAVFDIARAQFHTVHVDCDLSDLISYVIVTGIEQSRIISTDDHFRQLGLQVYP
jgi:predicted nucleic acid-binding protein